METVVIVSSKISGNDLARFAIEIEEGLSEKERKAAIVEYLAEVIEYREDDDRRNHE
jgi:hypothetical protein